MKKILFTILSFVFVFFCNAQSAAVKNELITKYADSTLKTSSLKNDSASLYKIIFYSQKIIQLDSNNFSAYLRKYGAELRVKLYPNALLSLNKLISLRPNYTNFYTSYGLVNDFIGKNNISKTYYLKSLNMCNKILDTMSTSNNQYIFMVRDKAEILILLDKIKESNILIQEVCKTCNSESNIKLFAPLLNTTKEEYITYCIKKI